uniref:Uncharacterized protein n=1 Tax=Arundo donax TaxID=35708 RepID=A0A0A9C9Z8_ARUDO
MAPTASEDGSQRPSPLQLRWPPSLRQGLPLLPPPSRPRSVLPPCVSPSHRHGHRHRPGGVDGSYSVRQGNDVRLGSQS